MQKIFLTAVKNVAQGQLQGECLKTRKAAEGAWDDIVLKAKQFNELPEEGVSQNEIIEMCKEWSKYETVRWNGTKQFASGSVYHGEGLIDLQKEIFSLFAVSNPLHPEIFGFTAKMEREIVRMTAEYFWGTEDTCGIVTTGGTASIIMAVRTFKQRGLKKGILEPELVVPEGVHAAFDKACELMEVKIKFAPIDPKTFIVNVREMEKLINSNTIGIVGSTPNYAHGTMDPIEELSKLALKKDVLLHVDCCLGSFLMPTLKRMGKIDAKFGFDLPGVSTISIDTHKFGFTVKGSSVLLYKNRDLRREGYFSAVDWNGGIYITPGIPGSRTGAITACTWAVMVSQGRKGYQKHTKNIMDTVEIMTKGVNSIPELQLHGDPVSSVIAFSFKDAKYCPFALAEAMSKNKWSLSKLQNPNSLHICVTNCHVGHAEKFVEALQKSVFDVVNHPEKYKGGESAFYGACVAIPDGGVKSTLVRYFMDGFIDGPK